jgi:DNA polymerase III epsilon subunit-like protein
MKITDATYALIDTETTRKDAADPENELIEVACDLYYGINAVVPFSESHSFSSIVYVMRPIPPENSAIHNLSTRDIIDAPERAAVIEQLRGFIPKGAIPVAHNAPFDSAVLADLNLGEWVCTERLAHPLSPGLGNYKLGTLRYAYSFFDIDYSGLPEERRVHSAAGDLRVLAPVFFHLIQRYRETVAEICGDDAGRLEKAEQVETMIAWAKRPYVINTMPFGKHKGESLISCPRSYLEWMLQSMKDLSPDLEWNIKRALAATA